MFRQHINYTHHEKEGIGIDCNIVLSSIKALEHTKQIIYPNQIKTATEIYNNFQSDRNIDMVEKIKDSISNKQPCFLNVKFGYASIQEFIELTFQIFRIQFNRDSSTNTPTYTLEFITLNNFDKIYKTSASLNKSFQTTESFEDVLLYILNAPFSLAKLSLPYKNIEDTESLCIFRNEDVKKFLKTKLPYKYDLIFDNTSAYSRAYSQALETFYQEFNRVLPKELILVNKITFNGVTEILYNINQLPTQSLIVFLDDSNIIGDVSVSSNPYFEFTTIFDPLYIIADGIQVRSQYLSMLTFSTEANYNLLNVSQYLVDKYEELEYTIEDDKSPIKFLLSCDIDFSTKVDSQTPTMVMRLTESVPKLNPNKTREKL